MGLRLWRVEPNRYARIGGALYLVIIVVGIVGPLLTTGQLVVEGDSGATARNIAASPGLWSFGIALNVVMQICDVPVMLILLVQIAGVCYVVNSLMLIVAPELASIVFLIPAFVAELSLALWLLIKGVDGSLWELLARNQAHNEGSHQATR